MNINTDNIKYLGLRKELLYKHRQGPWTKKIVSYNIFWKDTFSCQRTNLMKLLSKCIHKSWNKLNGYKNLPTIGILRVMICRNVAVHPDRPNSSSPKRKSLITLITTTKETNRSHVKHLRSQGQDRTAVFVLVRHYLVSRPNWTGQLLGLPESAST